MSPGVLGLALLLSQCVLLSAAAAFAEELLEVKSVLGDDCTLRCTAKHKPGVEYMAVRWYKVREPPAPRLSGLLTKELPDGETRQYHGVDREAELHGESHDIFLPNVTCSDGGLYTCHLAAPVGEQNREGQVLLTLTDCSEGPTKNLNMVIAATAVLIFALIIFLISYVCVKNIIWDRNKTVRKEILLDAPLKPLEKKDLKLIYTLGSKTSETPTIKHVCV
ncbi:hypothetical protein L3Q82_012930 [Scortum barcoo]|uniref:Uncharacterized protein n=1 Tax=Scortum barcoo TaxID=214431 RepID=A0ACB8W0P9_9TELE|nr:hypothetical protein L3Q82_012930 [Scortum barcoo]